MSLYMQLYNPHYEGTLFYMDSVVFFRRRQLDQDSPLETDSHQLYKNQSGDTQKGSLILLCSIYLRTAGFPSEKNNGLIIIESLISLWMWIIRNVIASYRIFAVDWLLHHGMYLTARLPCTVITLTPNL